MSSIWRNISSWFNHQPEPPSMDGEHTSIADQNNDSDIFYDTFQNAQRAELVDSSHNIIRDRASGQIPTSRSHLNAPPHERQGRTSHPDPRTDRPGPSSRANSSPPPQSKSQFRIKHPGSSRHCSTPRRRDTRGAEFDEMSSISEGSETDSLPEHPQAQKAFQKALARASFEFSRQTGLSDSAFANYLQNVSIKTHRPTPPSKKSSNSGDAAYENASMETQPSHRSYQQVHCSYMEQICTDEMMQPHEKKFSLARPTWRQQSFKQYVRRQYNTPIDLLKCFNCWEFGHVSYDCTSTGRFMQRPQISATNYIPATSVENSSSAAQVSLCQEIEQFSIEGNSGIQNPTCLVAAASQPHKTAVQLYGNMSEEVCWLVNSWMGDEHMDWEIETVSCHRVIIQKLFHQIGYKDTFPLQYLDAAIAITDDLSFLFVLGLTEVHVVIGRNRFHYVADLNMAEGLCKMVCIEIHNCCMNSARNKLHGDEFFIAHRKMQCCPFDSGGGGVFSSGRDYPVNNPSVYWWLLNIGHILQETLFDN